MDELFVYKGAFKTRDAVPTRDQVPELMDDDRLLYVVSELKETKYSRDKKKMVYTGETKFTTFVIDPDRVPTIEREYLADLSPLFRLGRQILRPIRILTREECNTRAGRMALLSWPNDFPRTMHEETVENLNADLLRQFDGMEPEQEGRSWFERQVFNPDNHPFYFWENNVTGESTNNILYRPQSDEILLHTYDGLFRSERLYRDADVDEYTFILPPVFREYLPDMAFAVDYDTEILNRDQFEQVVMDHAEPAAVPILLQKYDYCQKMVDRLFATYELFRTEKYESIAALPLCDQRAAIRNYFATFHYFGNRGAKVVAKVGGAELLTYDKPKYVVSNMAKYLGVPAEVMAYAKKTFAVEPLFGEKKKAAPQRVPVVEQNTGYRSRELDRQRTQYGTQLELYFGDYMGWPVPQIGNMVFDKGLLDVMTVHDTTNRKMFNELIYAATARPDFNLLDYVERVANVQSKEDVVELYKEMTFIVDYGEIVKRIYGKLSPENIKDLDSRIENLPMEPFVFYRMIESKGKDGKPRKIHITANRKSKYPRDRRELISFDKRFRLGGWLTEQDGKRKGLYRVIYVNPAVFSNMMDSNGNLTNYDRLTPEYMAYNRAVSNGDKITPAIEKILMREFLRRFPMATSATRAAVEDAKENEQERPDRQTLKNIRRDQFRTTIDKDKLFIAVCNNTGEITEPFNERKTTPQKYINAYTKGPRRTRIRQYIEQALATLKLHGVIIEDYSTTPDGTAWNVQFIMPSK